MDPKQFLTLIIRPTLTYLDLHSKEAEELLLGTAMVESRLWFLKQHPTGPALGVYQMEPRTHQDLWNSYLYRKPNLSQKVRELASMRFDFKDRELIGNLFYSTAMCRVHYYRIREPLPKDIPGYAYYWKKYYNTKHGKGTEEDYITHFPNIV